MSAFLQDDALYQAETKPQDTQKVAFLSVRIHLIEHHFVEKIEF